MSPQQKRKPFPGVGQFALLGLLLFFAQSCIYGERLECPGIVCPVNMACSPNGTPVCIPQGCGDGELVTGEECDAGGVETADCNINCKRPKCGDGVVNQLAGEQCDKFGEPNAECNLDCTISKCGDGKINSAAGEECDDGGESQDCNADCTKFEYGDGKVNSAAGEACDDGNLVDGDGCSSKGELESCGNKVIDTYEQCDDGKETKTCNADCTQAKCGDWKVNQAAGEQCDHGPLGSNTCNANCTVRQCGDGVVNEAAGEECDPGSDADSAECTSNCKKSFCGDGHTNEAAGEQCDAGGKNTDATRCEYSYSKCTVCTTSCKKRELEGPYCGDGNTDKPWEIYDDGDRKDNTECNEYGKDCTFSNADCTRQYTIKGPYCGDNINNGGEKCDRGLGYDSKTCNHDCTLQKCGDGIRNYSAESCDDGNTISGDGCDNKCQIESCGNGKLDPGEDCDKGAGNFETANCDRDCTFVRCLDEIINEKAGEVCRDGNDITEAECAYGSESCQVCSGDCKALMSRTGPYCGDGIINGPVGAEQCDVKDMPELCIVGTNQCKCTPSHAEINAEMDTFSNYKATDKIVVDTKSGLVWQREDDDVGRNWQEAKDYCSSLKLAGCSGWRLPTGRELTSLIDTTQSPRPFINKDAFPGTDSWYWSSTEYAIPDEAWYVGFEGDLLQRGNKTDNNYVRCVR